MWSYIQISECVSFSLKKVRIFKKVSILLIFLFNKQKNLQNAHFFKSPHFFLRKDTHSITTLVQLSYIFLYFFFQIQLNCDSRYFCISYIDICYVGHNVITAEVARP